MAAREIETWIKNKLSNLTGRIIDIGAGQCQYRKYCSHLDYVAQDLCRYDGRDEGKWDYSKIDIKSDIEDIPVPNESFDIVLCSDVLEHVPDAASAYHEMTRLLKRGGHIIISTPFNCLVHQEPYYYISGLHENWYRYHMREYDILEIKTDGNWFTQVKQEITRLKEPWLNRKTGKSISDDDLKLVNNLIKLLDTLNSGNTEKVLCGSYQVFARKK